MSCDEFKGCVTLNVSGTLQYFVRYIFYVPFFQSVARVRSFCDVGGLRQHVRMSYGKADLAGCAIRRRLSVYQKSPHTTHSTHRQAQAKTHATQNTTTLAPRGRVRGRELSEVSLSRVDGCESDARPLGTADAAARNDVWSSRCLYDVTTCRYKQRLPSQHKPRCIHGRLWKEGGEEGENI